MRILVFLGLSVLELGPMYVTEDRRQTDRRQTKALLNACALRRRRRNNRDDIYSVVMMTDERSVLFHE